MDQQLKHITNTNIFILLQTAQKLGIDYQILDWEKYQIQLSKADKTHLITKKSLGINSIKGIETSKDKHQTYQALQQINLPVLSQIKVKSLVDYQKKLKLIPFPQVIKPLLGEKGQNIYLNIKNQEQAEQALEEVLKVAPVCIVEPYFPAKDYRITVLNNQVIGLAQRIPSTITGDGKHTIKELIGLENLRRLKLKQKTGKRLLNRMLIWKRIKWYINQQSLKLSDVPEKKQKITVYPIPNFSTGGSVKTIALDQIHPSYLDLAVKAAQAVKLTIAGIDFLIKDLKQPANQKNCAIIEVNSDPGLRLHEWPNQGQPQNITEKILKFIFKE
jgi:cyanophycin synthetase